MPEDLEIVVEAYEDELTGRLRHWRDVLVRHGTRQLGGHVVGMRSMRHPEGAI